jgi:polysaccharide biosynthesis transport protein
LPSPNPAGPRHPQGPDRTEPAAADTLRQYWDVLRKRIWVVLSILAVAVTGTVLWTLHQPKIYEATATVIVNPQAPHVNKDEEVVDVGAGNPYAYVRDYYNTQIEVLTSFPLARATVVQGEPKFFEKLASKDRYPDLSEGQRIDKAAQSLVSMLSVDQHKESRVIAIHVRNRDPDVAEAIANAHVASYIAFIRSKRATGTGEASQLLAVQVDDAHKQVKNSEDKLLKFKTDNDMITQSFDDKQNTVVTELQRYSAALADAKVKRIELEAQKKRAEALANEDVLESPIFALTPNQEIDGAIIKELKTEYIRAKQKYDEANATYGPKSEELQSAKQKVDDIYGQLKAEGRRAQREIDERYQAALGAEKGYQALVDARRADAQKLDNLYAQYEPLVHDEKFAEDEYTKLVGRLDSSKHENQNDMINVDPHEQALDAVQVLPRMKLNVALAVLLSLMLGFAVAFLLDQMDRTIKGVEGIEGLVGAPVLGIIPVIEGQSGETPEAAAARDLFVAKHPTSQVAECCRSIRTNILFSAAERPMKIITVSSSRPREGKTTTTIYLGTTMAQSGQKVLLIDTDLRRPRLHKSLGVSRERGITTLLLGEATYEDVIKSTDVPNLYVLPCGPQPPNPAELLLTKRFKTVLEDLSQRFDRILLDSPPLLAVTDAAVLARTSEGVVLVAQSGATRIDDVAASVRQIRDVEAPILGVILNTVDISDRRYGYYYGYYSYGTYGEQPEAKTS